jgi:hypothetical protein
MFQVQCPECSKIREVKAKKSWMQGEPPYTKICKACCQPKTKTEEHKQKLKEAIKQLQTPEVLEKKKQFMLEHPEHWQKKLIPGKGGGWNKGLKLPPKSDETKNKISDSMKNRKKNK